jgi:hypothetical protein
MSRKPEGEEVPWGNEEGTPEKEAPKRKESEAQRKADEALFGGSEGAGIKEVPFDTTEREAEDFEAINVSAEEVRRLMKEHLGSAPSDKMQFLDYGKKAEEQASIREAMDALRTDLSDFQKKYVEISAGMDKKQLEGLSRQLDELKGLAVELNAIDQSLEQGPSVVAADVTAIMFLQLFGSRRGNVCARRPGIFCFK